MTQYTPTDHLYQRGVPLQPEKIVNGLHIADTDSTVAQDIDWNQALEPDDPAASASASATSHYHYQKISHLLLCDHIVMDARNVPAPAQRIAEQLAQQNAKEIKAWTEYMQKTSAGGSICREQQEYYRILFTQQDVLPVLLGVQTINLAADASYEEFYKHADPAFQKLADGFAEENQNAYTTVRDDFAAVIRPMDQADRMRLLQNVAQQVDLCQIIMQQRDEDVFRPLNSEAQQGISRAGQKVKQFYNEIGLTAGIF